MIPSPLRTLRTLALTLCLAVIAPGAAAAQSWIQLNPSAPLPAGRFLHGAVYDSGANRLTIFGGHTSDGAASVTPTASLLLGDAWQLSGANGNGGVPPAWAPLAIGGDVPPPTAADSMVYDPATARAIVFGGEAALSPLSVTVTGEVYRALLGVPTWTRAPASFDTMLGTARHTAVYDPFNNKMIVFGGETFVQGFPLLATSNVYVLTNANGADVPAPVWSGRAPGASAPTPRLGHSAIYEPITTAMVVFGGASPLDPSCVTCSATVALQDDVWVLPAANSTSFLPAQWTRLITVGTPPPARMGHSAVYDFANDRMIVFGGGVSSVAGVTLTAHVVPTNDVWVLTNPTGLNLGPSAWSQLTPAGGPPPVRMEHTAAWDWVTQRMIVFGGLGLEPDGLTDTWVLALLPSFTLSVVREGTGTGGVVSADGGIACGATCSHAYVSGTGVTLTATADPGSTFTGWSGGGCVGTGACTVTVTADVTIRAEFTSIQTFNLTVALGGTGTGGVVSAPAGIDCPATCQASYAAGTSVSLTATPAAGSTFTGWSGGCSGTGPCNVTMTADVTVTATFAAVQQFTLTVQETGQGRGSVVSAPAGIDCPATCQASYAAGTSVSLTATPVPGDTFVGWSGGGCSGTGPCTVTMTADVSVVARFDRLPLRIRFAGPGRGSVVSSPAGIHCPAICRANFTAGTSVTLTAAPNAGDTFVGWSGGGCSGTGPCNVTVTAAVTVTARFDRFTLRVRRTGPGRGSVASSPPGIVCPTACRANYEGGTSVTLTATPNPGDTFVGWSGGGCSGTGSCNLTMTSDVTITARFERFTLHVRRVGGGGSVASVPGGIQCPGACDVNFTGGTPVTLTATPVPGWAFAGWSGSGCGGLGACNVTVNSDLTVTATFRRTR